MLERFLEDERHAVWDAGTGRKLRNASLDGLRAMESADPSEWPPGPAELAESARAGKTAFLICPMLRVTFSVLLAAGALPDGLSYVVGILASGGVPEGVLADIPDDMLLLLYEDGAARGRLAGMFEFRSGSMPGMFRFTGPLNGLGDMLEAAGNEQLLTSLTWRKSTPRAFGFESLPELSQSQKQDVAMVIGRGCRPGFFDDGLPYEMRSSIATLWGMTRPRDGLPQPAPGLSAYMPLWMSALSEEAARLEASGARFEGELPADGLAGMLDEFGAAHGMSAMMDAVDAGVPADDVTGRPRRRDFLE